MDSTLNEIIEATTDASKDLIHSEMSLSFNQLRQKAQEFLLQLVTIYENGDKYRVHSNGSKELMRLWTIYRDTQTARALALLQNNFALALDAFLDRKIILTYVDKQGNLLLYTEEGEIEILNKVTKNEGRGNFSMKEFGKAEQIQKLPADLRPGTEEDLIAAIHASVAEKQQVYQTGYERYDKVRKGLIHDKITRRYYWRLNASAIDFPENGFSLGEMAEAYANVIIQRDRDVTNATLESSLQVLYNRYIKSKKDNIPAILKGDVVVNENGNISLAVKGQSASTAKIGQYIVAAHYIVTMPNLTPNQLKEWLKEIPKINDYAEKIEQEAEKLTFEEILKNIPNTIPIVDS